MNKKRVKYFLITVAAIIVALFLIRLVYILCARSTINDTVMKYEYLSYSYLSLTDEAIKNKTNISDEAKDDFIKIQEAKLSEVAVPSQEKEVVEVLEFALSNFMTGFEYEKSQKISFIIDDIDFNLDCSEVTVTIKDNIKIVRALEGTDRYRPYLFTDKSVYEVKLIKEDDSWKVRSNEMRDWLTSVKKHYEDQEMTDFLISQHKIKVPEKVDKKNRGDVKK